MLGRNPHRHGATVQRATRVTGNWFPVGNLIDVGNVAPTGGASWVMPVNDHDRAEMQALCDQFRELMQRDVERTVFDKEACRRIGEVIGRAPLGLSSPAES